MKDQNYVAKIEKAIKDKYGEKAIHNPRSGWDKEKEEEYLRELKKINEKRSAIVSMSFSSVDDEIAKVVEPGCDAPSKRLETLESLKKQGISIGMYLLPIIPKFSDSPKLIDAAFKKARKIGCDFVIFGSMTLKPGRS